MVFAEKMKEVAECTKILLNRIQKLEPENCTKIISYLFLIHNDEEIIKYANGPDTLIHSMIDEFRAYLMLSPKPFNSDPIPPLPNHPLQCMPSSAISGPFSSHSAADQQPAVDNLNDYDTDEDEGLATGMRSPPSVSKSLAKACHNFYAGLCKNGFSCRHLHGQTISDGFSVMLDPNFAFRPGSLLEMEIVELLRARGGMPVYIAALPLMYHAKYGKTLQADRYFTESQSHRKTGLSLTKLLGRLPSISVIDRPHGQHFVVLADYDPKYVGYRNKRDDSCSHQIYFTFPSESTFTEEDVWEYFGQYGTVHSVRIPHKQKRMFGFVNFLSPETVLDILGSEHPHVIRGAFVLVKPYKEKPKVNDRNFTEKIELPLYLPSQYFEVNAGLNSLPRVCENSIMLEKQLIQDHEQAFECEKRCLLELQLTPEQLTPHSNVGYRKDELIVPEDHISSFPLVKNFFKFDEESSCRSKTSSYQDRDHIELPDSPFTFP